MRNAFLFLFPLGSAPLDGVSVPVPVTGRENKDNITSFLLSLVMSPLSNGTGTPTPSSGSGSKEKDKLKYVPHYALFHIFPLKRGA